MSEPTDRLDKLVAERTGQSRRQARALILRGRVSVSQPGGSEAADPMREPSTRVPTQACITVDGRVLAPPPVLAILHKPTGVLTAVRDPQARPCLADVAQDLLDLGLHPVGRLDKDTDGLLPFSRDGGLTQHLLHPRHGVQKRYRARVDALVDAHALAQRLADGVKTSDGVHTAILHHVQDDIVELSVAEGKHRMVRRMLANVGAPVLELRRLAFGAMTLGALPSGHWRPASHEELDWLRARVERGTGASR